MLSGVMRSGERSVAKLKSHQTSPPSKNDQEKKKMHKKEIQSFFRENLSRSCLVVLRRQSESWQVNDWAIRYGCVQKGCGKRKNGKSGCIHVKSERAKA